MSLRILQRPPQSSNTPLLIALLLVGLAVAAIFWYGDRLHDAESTVVSGDQLYNQQCAACHGNLGEGNPTLNAPPLNNTGPLPELADGVIQRAILTGGEIMPAHEQILTSAQAADIIQYIKTWWTAEQIANQQALSEQDPLQP